MNTAKKTRTFYVAKCSVGYAVEGRDCGMGNTIEHTKNVWRAKRFDSPAGIMSWMGGHYRSYQAIKIRIKSEMTILGRARFPKPETVFSD